MKEHTAFLGTGSNLGDRPQVLEAARQHITQRAGLVIQASHLYRTQAWGLEDQPEFLNQVLQLRTSLAPEVLLDTLLAIERAMGRQRRQKWGARLIDIDILFYDDLIVNHPQLKIPHPYLTERNFVLAPLAEIAPNWQHPVFGKSVSELLAQSPDPLEVEIVYNT